MATLKRQKADGTWEYVQVVGSDLISRLNALSTNKQDKLDSDRIRKITISQAPPTGGSDGDIWFQYE